MPCQIFYHKEGQKEHVDTNEQVPGVLTEQEVSRSWRNLFKSTEFSDETLQKAEALLDQLRAESPLRHRLSVELDELRKIKR